MTLASAFFFAALLLITVMLVIRLSRFENLAIVFFFVGAISVVYAANISLLSLPKPIENEYFRDGTGTVHYFYLVEDEAIYLLFQDNPEQPPRWYVMPWVEKHAARLEQLRRGSIGILAINLFGPFDRSRDVAYFHEIPPPKYEAKVEPVPPTMFDLPADE